MFDIVNVTVCKHVQCDTFLFFCCLLYIVRSQKQHWFSSSTLYEKRSRKLIMHKPFMDTENERSKLMIAVEKQIQVNLCATCALIKTDYIWFCYVIESRCYQDKNRKVNKDLKTLETQMFILVLLYPNTRKIVTFILSMNGFLIEYQIRLISNRTPFLDHS